MFLDNIISGSDSQAVRNVSYAECVEAALLCSEVESEGMIGLISAEASRAFVGNEGPKEFWQKVQSVARRIWEALKTLVNKIFTFVKTIPTRIATIAKKLLAKWEKIGIKGKIERMNKKANVSVRTEKLKEVAGKEFGIFVEPEAFTRDEATKVITETAAKFKSSKPEQVTEIVAELKKGYREEKYAESDKKSAGYKIEGITASSSVDNIKSAIEKYYDLIKNGKYEKASKDNATALSRSSKDIADAASKFMSDLDKARRAEDEDAGRAILQGLRGLRVASSYVSIAAARGANLNASSLFTAARIVNALLACVKTSGEAGK